MGRRNWQGNTVSTERYMPFGATRSGSMPTDLQFTGQRRQAESAVGQFYHFGARSMLPAIGRFVSADSVVPGAGDPQVLDRYSYDRNSPLGRIDPSRNVDLPHFMFSPFDVLRYRNSMHKQCWHSRVSMPKSPCPIRLATRCG